MIEVIKTKVTLGLLALPFVFAGCSGDENLPGGEVNDGRVALQVSSGIQTRAFDNQWEDDDQIGIFMLDNGQNTVADGYDNVPYRVASAGEGGKAFNPVDEVIYFPTNGDKRDFIAYYPYSASKVANGVYAIDLTNQDPQRNIDFMLAGKVADKSRSDANVSFQFAHKLAKIVMDIEPGEGVTADDLKHITVSLTGQPTEGTFDVLNGQHVTVTSTDKKAVTLLADAEGTHAEGIVFPSENYDGMSFTFATQAIGGYEWPLSKSEKATKFEAGKKYLYTITVNKTEINVTSTIKDWEPGNEGGESGSAE